MVSNHFPSTYGQSLNWIVLGVIMVGGALSRHFLNIRFTFQSWRPAFAATVAVTLVALFVLTRPAERPTSSTKVTFAQARGIIQARCTTCHSQHPTDDVWKTAPTGIVLDTPEQMKALAARILERAVVNKTMPLGNKTQMTDPERELLGAWVDQGASTE
jgi:uncharacterized membrane protein